MDFLSPIQIIAYNMIFQNNVYSLNLFLFNFEYCHSKIILVIMVKTWWFPMIEIIEQEKMVFQNEKKKAKDELFYFHRDLKSFSKLKWAPPQDLWHCGTFIIVFIIAVCIYLQSNHLILLACCVGKTIKFKILWLKVTLLFTYRTTGKFVERPFSILKLTQAVFVCKFKKMIKYYLNKQQKYLKIDS